MAAALTRYEILGHLASGGMGEILLARRLGPAGFEQRVVLKRPLGATTRAHVTALIDEARLLARIHHPNVCQVHDLEEGEAGYFLVLEYLEGMSCWTLLTEAERAGVVVPPGALCGLVEQVCDGLEAIHALAARDGRPAGIVHRDVSPGNLFVTEAGVAKILDLGIAKTDEADTTAPGAGPRGKLPYLSPEQVAGRAVDRRADVFALGLVLYDLACGRPPAPDRVGALAAPELALDDLPVPLAEVIRTAVAVDPARRFATASAMAAALRRAGGALGGAFGRAELAAWLSAQFGGVLAAQRARLPGTGGSTSPDAPSVTQRVELRSLVRGADGDGDGRNAAADNATAQLPPPPPLIRERTHPAIGQVEALVGGRRAPAPPARRAKSGARLAAAAVLFVAGALGAAAWWRSTAGPPSTPPGAIEPPSTAPPTAGPSSAPQQATDPSSARPPSAEPPHAPPPADEPSSVPPSTAAPASASPPMAAPSSAPQQAVEAQPGAATAAQSSGTAPASAAVEPPAPAPTAPASAPAVHRGAPAAEAAARRPGRLSVDSEPFAVIELDGKPLGTTPLYRVPVTPGRHQLRAETGDGRVQRRAIDVAPGAVSAVVLRWAGRAPGGAPGAATGGAGDAR